MAYQDAVAEAASALTRGEDANWQLARLTWENTISIPGANSQTGRVSMRQWCADVETTSKRRFSMKSGETYKGMWKASLPRYAGEAELPSWTEAYDEYDGRGSFADRFADAKARQGVTSASVEVRQDLAAKLMADPEVADAVMDQPQARRAVYDSLQRQEHRAEVKHQTMRAADPVGQRLDREAALIDLEKTLRRFADDARTLTAAIGTLPERSDGAIAPHLFLRQSYVAAEDALGSVRTLLETGVSDLDNFLDGVLKGAS